MNNTLLISFRVSLFTLFLLGIVYPFGVTELADVLFKKEADGSVIYTSQGMPVGSEWIGQNFKNTAYFNARPSAAGQGYNGMASQGSNLGPTSKKLLNRIENQLRHLQAENTALIPMDMVTMSASGLDPHISPQSAYWQAPQVALKRDVSLQRVLRLISDQIEPPQFYFMGQSRVNVLKLNLALDQFFGPPGLP